MAGQTLHDRLTAARHIITGQSLAKSVCKATTEEIIGPKKKHLDYLIHCTQEPNVSVPELCNMLIERTQQSSWVVVFKALITAHHLMCYGNEKFVQCMATTSCTFHLSTFVDKTGSQGYDMSTFVRRYAKYLNAKASTYRTMGADFCKMKRGKDEGVLRNMSTESLLKTLPILHEQLDALIEFDCNPDDLSNGVMNSCFMLLYRDLIQLFAAYNDGIINLFDKYFTMNKKYCKEALDNYKKFIVAMDKVSDFLKVAESVGIDKGNIPDLTKAPASLLEEMENHLTFLEGKKGHSATRANAIQNAVPAFENTSTAFSASIDSSHELNGLTVDESVRRAVEEEAAVMYQLKCGESSLPSALRNKTEQRMKEIASRHSTPGDVVASIKQTTSAPASSVPSPIPPPSSLSSVSPTAKMKQTHVSCHSIAGEDLITMANFTHNGNLTVSQAQPLQQVPFNQNTYEGNVVPPANFVSEASFKTAFNAGVTPTSSSSFDVFGEVLKPVLTVSPTSSSPVPDHCESKSPPPGPSKLISSDLDSSLQTLVQNLDINGPKKPLKCSSHQWGSPKPATRTGGTNWSPSSATMTNWGTSPNVQQPVVNMPIGAVPFNSVPIMNTSAPYGYQSVPPGMMSQMPYRMPAVWHSNSSAFGVTQQQMSMYAASSPQHSTIQSGNPTGEPSSRDPFGAL